MTRMPFLSFIFGILSPFPLILLTILILFFSAITSVDGLLLSFIGYAALVLAFIGGMNWILAMQKPVIILQGEENFIDKRRVLFSVILCLIGETSIILGACHHIVAALLLLMISFLVTLAYERRLYLTNELPLGYMPLRWGMTAIMETCFLVVLLIRML